MHSVSGFPLSGGGGLSARLAFVRSHHQRRQTDVLDPRRFAQEPMHNAHPNRKIKPSQTLFKRTPLNFQNKEVKNLVQEPVAFLVAE